MSKHYDVVVLGAGIGALTAAALLARRSWRVLVLGQGYRPATYAYDGLPLARRPFTLLANSSPAWGRILAELAQSQTFRRRTTPLDPMLQVATGQHRLDLPPDTAVFGKEVDREFPGVRRVVEELYAELARTNAAADAAFEKDVVWPPGSFWERRETARVLSTLPHVKDGAHDLLAEFPRDHAYRLIVEVPAQFASDLHGTLPPFAIARLQGAWTRGVVRLARGEEEITDFLVERVRAHGGEVALGDRASAITHRGGKVTGVVLDGSDASTGVQFVVSDLPTRTVLDLASGFVPSRRQLLALPMAAPRSRRFVVGIAVKDAGIPQALAAESFLIPDGGRPVVHLQRVKSAPFPPVANQVASDVTLLIAETLLEGDAASRIAIARESVLACVQKFLPFIEQHYLVVDSPHDGRPLWDFRSGDRKDIDRSRVRATGAGLDAEPMIPQYEIEPTQLHGLGGEPLRTPLAGAFVVGRTTMPALGQEGELLAAWGAARMITRTDRRKEKMRRDMWSKVELG
ncbi:MAG: Lycopene beta cyclase [Myxococcaceae bacterium]|nr:Lycopene beta cyclase [Myxococcaceae bacterium]